MSLGGSHARFEFSVPEESAGSSATLDLNMLPLLSGFLSGSQQTIPGSRSNREGYGLHSPGFALASAAIQNHQTHDGAYEEAQLKLVAKPPDLPTHGAAARRA